MDDGDVDVSTVDNKTFCFYSSKCSIKYFSEYLVSLYEILAAYLSFVVLFISDYPFRSATDKQRSGLVSAKGSFFFSLKSELHQLSVMSCQASCSSKECAGGLDAKSPLHQST